MAVTGALDHSFSFEEVNYSENMDKIVNQHTYAELVELEFYWFD